jgi:AbiV family abortive infection protein
MKTTKTSSPVTPQLLLEGFAYALEQCGYLLRDANILYRSESYADAVVLAAFAREELGRSGILLEMRRQAIGGAHFTIKQVQERCADHVTKQREGMLSTVMRTDRDTGLGKLLQTRIKTNPQSAEWRKADEELKAATDRMKKRTPTARHEQRMLGLYVEPGTDGKWNRPNLMISRSLAENFLTDAANDYAGRYRQGYITSSDSILKHTDPDLYSALEQWRDRPALQPPEWPQLVVSVAAGAVPAGHTIWQRIVGIAKHARCAWRCAWQAIVARIRAWRRG